MIQSEDEEKAEVLTQSAVPITKIDPPVGSEQQHRAAAYGLLAALLRASPDADLLAHVRALETVPARDEIGVAMSLLGLAARGSEADQLEDEFHDLFIGIGRGELVPFGSWYLTGFLMERPLGELRDDLAVLGFTRADDVKEPEDHVGALCEVMAMLIDESAPLATQSSFFTRHMTWLDPFFADLQQAQAAVFYRAVGRMGAAFVALEREYLDVPDTAPGERT